MAEVQLGGRDRVFDVTAAAGAHDRDIDGRVGKRPRDREASHRHAEVVPREPLQLTHDLEIAAVAVPREEGCFAAPIAGWELGPLVERACQQPVGERAVDQHADVVIGAVGQHLALDVAAEQVIGRL